MIEPLKNLRISTTVLRPGEVLIVQCPKHYKDKQMRFVADQLGRLSETHIRIPFIVARHDFKFRKVRKDSIRK